MKKLLFTLLVSITSTLLLAQEQNVLFTPYTIGDSINKNIERLFIYDSKHEEYLKADNLNAAQYVYFPNSEDSSVFSLMKFNVVLIRNNKKGEGLVNSIWLLDPVSVDTTNNNVFANYTAIKNYLDEKLKVTPEEQNENYNTSKSLKNWVWRTEKLDYHLNCNEAHSKKGEKNLQLSVVID